MNQLKDIFSKHALPVGRCIAPSKTDYQNNNNPHYFIPNALIFNEQEYTSKKDSEPIWHGDLDLVKDTAALRNSCKEMQAPFVITSEQKEKIRTMRPNEAIMSPKDFDYLFEKDRLGTLALRKEYAQVDTATTREITLPALWKTILQQSVARPVVSPDEIKSIILFGSVVNKSPYKMVEGNEHSLWRWKWRDAPTYTHTPFNDVDVLVLTTNRNETAQQEALLLDIGYPVYSQVRGNFDILYTSIDNFVDKAKKQTKNTMNILQDGIILADDGTFQEISKPYERIKKQQYVLEWFLQDEYDSPGILGTPSVIRRDVLHGSLDFVGFIPYVFNKEQ